MKRVQLTLRSLSSRASQFTQITPSVSATARLPSHYRTTHENSFMRTSLRSSAPIDNFHASFTPCLPKLLRQSGSPRAYRHYRFSHFTGQAFFVCSAEKTSRSGPLPRLSSSRLHFDLIRWTNI